MNLVSVIIPFYNSSKFMHRAIGSVINQTYTNWEIVLVDDGSTDNSIEIAQMYSSLYKNKIRVYQQSNKGPGIARNKGFYHSKGEYIALLDSDDEWEPGFLEKILLGFEICIEADIIYVNARRLDENKKIINRSVFDDSSSIEFRKLHTINIGNTKLINDSELLKVAIKSTIKCGSNSVYKRKVINSVSYLKNVFSAQDRFFNIFAIASGFRYAYIDDILINLYHHSGNLSLIIDNQYKRIRYFESIINGYKQILNKCKLDHEMRDIVMLTLSNCYLDYSRTLWDFKLDFKKQFILIFNAVCIYAKNDRFYKFFKKKLKLFGF